VDVGESVGGNVSENVRVRCVCVPGSGGRSVSVWE
jgi:hypothetical protein